MENEVADSKEIIETPKLIEPPLVFISHDSRDADLAEAFGKLLKSISAGMLKSFRSSDKKGTEGIEFGDEWYKALMTKLTAASDVVCLLTERSLERPWILYEAGVAKGRLNTPVHGIALGVPLASVASGPFYQFQNSDDSQESLTKLVLQLCRRISNLEPDQDVVANQVRAFKTSVTEALKNLGGQKKVETQVAVNEGSVAKVLEEMKLLVRDLSMRLEERVMFDGAERHRVRQSSLRKLSPRMISEIAHMTSRRSDDPIGILVIASFVRDDFPWLYELGLEAYRKAKGGTIGQAAEAIRAFRDSAEMTLHSPFLKVMGIDSEETRMLGLEIPEMIHHYLARFELRESPASKRTPLETDAKAK
jgi:hypothetical protein